MSTLVLPPAPALRTPSAVSRRLPVAILAVVGGALAMGGAAAPWLSFFAGLQPITGLDGANGQIGAALGAASIAAGLGFLATGLSPVRWLLGLLGFATLSLAGWSGLNLVATLATLQADPLLVAEVGPGLPLLAVAGALAFSTMFLPATGGAVPTTAMSAASLRRVVVASLAVAGLVHVALGPEHLAESVVVGGAMTAAGIGQVGLAVLVGRRQAIVPPLVLAVVLSVAVAAAYLAAVTVGLPVEPHPHGAAAAGAAHASAGHVEPVTPLGLATLGFELAGAAAGIAILARGRRPEAPRDAA